MFLFVSVVVGVLSLALAFEKREDVIASPLNSSGREACLIFMQGADIQPEQYLPLTHEIQKQASGRFSLWVAIPEYPLDMVNPLVIDKGIERVLEKLRQQGAKTDTLIFAGHSLGGAMIQMWADKHRDMVAAQVLMGAFLTRMWKTDYVFKYSVPTLTIGGELDGLARVTRMAEAFYTQLLDPTQSNNEEKFPVTVIQGVTHMQFASGDIPSTVFKRDLLPEVSYEQAHELIARDFVAFISTTILSDEVSKTLLMQRLQETKTFVTPIIDALQLEGYHNFRPPCLCSDDVCQPSDNCTAACPFTTQFSQDVMGTGLKGLDIQNTDSFHDVWETKPTVHLPSIANACETPEGCTLKTFTITQGVYHTGQDLEIWKIHVDVPMLDSGFFPISAIELRTKMSSRQNVYSRAGIPDPDFETLDGGGVRCAEINQKSLDVALSLSADKTVRRFEEFGQPLVMGSDIDVCPAGPCWIWKELQYVEKGSSSNKTFISVESPQFSTALDFYLPKTAGFHYCKVLSPARAVEWLYVDGLREKYALSS